MSTRMREEIKKLADHIDTNYEEKESIDESIDGDIDEEASDGSETTLENMSESDSESILDPIEEEPELVTPPPSPVKKPKRKYTRKPKPETLKTSDPNIEVEVKTRKRGPKTKVITIYKEDIKVEPLIIREKVRRPRGRPQKQKQIEIIKDSDDDDIVVVPKPHPQKELTRKQLKELELHTKLAELQLISGNPSLKLTKKGTVDKRMVKTRTPAQLKATQNLIELNKMKRLRKKEDLKNELLNEQKTIVSNVINSLNQTTVTEKEDEAKQAAAKKQEADKKQAAAKKAMSLFD